MLVFKVSSIRVNWLRRTAIMLGVPVLAAAAVALSPIAALAWIVASVKTIAMSAAKHWTPRSEETPDA